MNTRINISKSVALCAALLLSFAGFGPVSAAGKLVVAESFAPSAGWASFYSYGGGLTRTFGNPRLSPFNDTHLENATRELVRNLSGTPVYVLHGEKDDNVPVRESREMVKLLGSFHPDFTYHEQPGAGHWWGNACVDWDPLFEFCRRHVRVEQPREPR